MKIRMRESEIPDYLRGFFRRCSQIKPKDDMLIPQRLALALQADGWWIRSIFNWYKINGLPSSVSDRFGVNHETFIMATRSESYYWDRHAVLLPYAESTLTQVNKSYTGQSQKDYGGALAQNASDTKRRIVKSLSSGDEQNPVGRNRRTADTFLESLDEMILEQQEWLEHLRHVKANGGLVVDPEGDPLAILCNTQPFTAKKYGIEGFDHYAVFSPKLVSPLIRASVSQYGCCTDCGAPWKRILEKGEEIAQHWAAGMQKKILEAHGQHGATSVIATGSVTQQNTVGWQKTCKCQTDEVRRPVVLDPFSGSGATGEAAINLGCDYIGVELCPKSANLSEVRLNHVLGRVGLFAEDAREEEPVETGDVYGKTSLFDGEEG